MKPAQALFFFLIALINLVKAQEPIASAHCNFDEESGNTNNYVALVEMDDGTSVIMGFVHGLGPNPLHGFHIHEFGDLSDGCASCGGHFNPYGKDHGGPNSEDRHVGDLGNIAADPEGNSVVFIADTQVKLTGDDLGASGDASGAAGPRLKCCIIRVDYIPPN